MHLVIIGNGMVGYKLCEKLVSAQIPGLSMEVFGEEIRPAYDRVHLSSYFESRDADALLMADRSWYDRHRILLHLADPVKEVDLEARLVKSHSGRSVPYDFLVFATGSSAFVPAIPGIEKEGVMIYRTIEDLELMERHAPRARKGAVIGGGLLGLEAAKAMLDLGVVNTQVIEFAPRLMPRQIDDAGSRVLAAKLAKLGLGIHTQKNTTSINGGQAVESLSFADGSVMEVDMLVISAGIKPRDEVAAAAGLEVGPRGGIVVNSRMQTSDPHVFAIGECALFENMVYGLVAPGFEMAEVVVACLSGKDKSFTGFDMSTKLKLIGVDVASFGDPFCSGETVRPIIFEDLHKGVYKRINIDTHHRKLMGGILVGDATSYHQLQQIVRGAMPLPDNPEELIIGVKKESAGGGLETLPGDALICSCEAVTKNMICEAVKKGSESVEAIRKCTKAGSGCGGCVPLVKDLVNTTLAREGKFTRNVLCEHFEFSRQELFDLIRINHLKTYEEVLDRFGRGDGCELCKPPVASILASLWNEMILRKGNATAQDSNDRFLANIQKGGTYSVVPRIPGGEISPDKLIVIGEVARKYNLYTKITGGQRIDLFGAHLVDLPYIWEELIAAGFESGHAYGKSLRTVKSCVGSTWCRFGLHDSVSFAIRIEERYRGLRAPHKLKSAVSGCIRECAEAQSKDFGIIATEKGWNLYVCGNGGSKPQHALLLASDVDEETCIRLIDRFLMFYIKTADPLTRTATWLNKMEGGIEYLKTVVLHDSLGICAELEAEMQTLVDNYKCEWKEAVENPDIRKRFSHFINAPTEKDPTISFDPLRDQKRASEWR